MNKIITAVLLSVIVGVVLPLPARAADSLEVSGWIPYWRVSEGIRDAKQHLDVLTEMHPFGYAVRIDGTLNDLAGLKKSAWQKLFRSARSKDVRIVPTVMWSSGDQIHAVLSDEKSRAAHIKEIVSMVKNGKYDGVDIDYEGKRAATKEYFSLFLKELKKALGSKMLTCAIEARTPPESLYASVPVNLEYANDLKAIGTHCDRVAVMTYDQQRADIKLNAENVGAPYMPISDIKWVRKVMDHMAKEIPKDKLVLGISTYGHEYEVVVSPNWYQNYVRQWSLNPSYAEDTAQKKKIDIGRHGGGEAFYSYLPDWSPDPLIKLFTVPENTARGNTVAAQALTYANMTGKTVRFNLVWWNDAEAIEKKVELAKELGLRGVALFKIDGGEDQDLWNIFED